MNVGIRNPAERPAAGKGYDNMIDGEIDFLGSVHPTHDFRTAFKIIGKEEIHLKIINLDPFFAKWRESLVLSTGDGLKHLLKQFASQAGLEMPSIKSVIDGLVICLRRRGPSRPSAKKTSIVMLSHGIGKFTRGAVISLRQFTLSPIEIIIVDNNSPDSETRDIVKKLGDDGLADQVILNDTNLGVPAGWNQGLSKATGDYYMVLNNDILATPGWLESMLHCLESEEEVGCVGNRTNQITGAQKVFNAPEGSIIFDLLPAFSKEWCRLHENGWWQSIRIRGFCMLFKREVFQKTEGFDERYGMGNFEDDDMCIQLMKLGYKLFIVDDSYLHHFGSLSFGNLKSRQKALHKTQAIFIDKWKAAEPALLRRVGIGDGNRKMKDYVLDLDSLKGTAQERKWEIKEFAFWIPKEIIDLYENIQC